jgi:hypothetical protein
MTPSKHGAALGEEPPEKIDCALARDASNTPHRPCRRQKHSLASATLSPKTHCWLAALVLCAALAAQHTAAAAPTQGQAAQQPNDSQGPVLSSFEVAQGAILLHFAHVEGSLRLRGRARECFQIAGADHIWFPADAHLVNGVVVVSTSLVQQPAEVLYNPGAAPTPVLSDGAGHLARAFHAGP